MTQLIRNRFSFIAAALLLTIASVPALAAADAPTDTTSLPAQETAAPPASTGGAPLQGGVKLVELSLANLRDLGLDLKHVMSGASHLYDEVNLAPVSLQTMPEVIGRGIIINIPVGTMPAGPPAPPRKARLDVAMNEITPIITQLKTDVDAFLSGEQRLDISEDTRAELRPVFVSWSNSVTAMANELAKLTPLTAGPKFDNAAISVSAKALQTQCGILQKDLKKVYKTFQREGKKSKKA